MKIGRKTVIFLGDGMADEPIEALGNRTPLEAAHTPGMDRIAREGRSGTLLTLPDGFPTSSEVANMTVLGCDLPSEYCGRGPMEAAGRGVPLGPNDIAFRLNLVTVSDGILRDFSGGHIAPGEADELIAALNDTLGTPEARFYTGVSYRNLLVLSGEGLTAAVRADKPDDNHGERVSDHLPRATEPGAQRTEALLRGIIAAAPAVLESHPVNRRRVAAGLPPANGVWPWSGGRAGALRSIESKYGVRGAVITAVDVIAGMGRLLGLDVIPVPGATGYIDTNYEGKAAAALAALRSHDFVYLHVEAIDEVSHAQNLALKLQAIEDFDRRIIVPVLDAAGPEVNAAVLPDHPVPLRLGRHTRTPVPVAVRQAGVQPDGVASFGERACLQGALGALRGDGLMRLLFG